MNPADLVDQARQVAAGAYAPYSKFRVGAAVVTGEGTVYTATNVENAAYAVTQCAEANAIAYAVSHGARKIPVVAVACIDAVSPDSAYPCGRCRQIMNEFGVETVYVADGASGIAGHAFTELFPHGFSL